MKEHGVPGTPGVHAQHHVAKECAIAQEILPVTIHVVATQLKPKFVQVRVRGSLLILISLIFISKFLQKLNLSARTLSFASPMKNANLAAPIQMIITWERMFSQMMFLIQITINLGWVTLIYSPKNYGLASVVLR